MERNKRKVNFPNTFLIMKIRKKDIISIKQILRITCSEVVWNKIIHQSSFMIRQEILNEIWKQELDSPNNGNIPRPNINNIINMTYDNN